MIYEIDSKLNFGRYKNKTIRDVLHIDSGYIKDLIRLRDTFVISQNCLLEAINITRGHRENWEKPKNPKSMLDGLKVYGVPYLYDFSTADVVELAYNKLNKKLNLAPENNSNL